MNITRNAMKSAGVEYADLYPLNKKLRKQLRNLGVKPKSGFNAMVKQYYETIVVPLKNKMRQRTAADDELFTSSYDEVNHLDPVITPMLIAGGIKLTSGIIESQSNKSDQTTSKKVGYRVQGGTMKYVRENYPDVDFTTLINTNNQAALAPYFTVVGDVVYPSDWVRNGQVNIPELFAHLPIKPGNQEIITTGLTTAPTTGTGVSVGSSGNLPTGSVSVTPSGGIVYNDPMMNNGRVNTTPAAPTTASMLSGDTIKIVIGLAVAFVLYKVFTNK